MGQLFNPSLQIGNVVVGGTAGSVLFVDAALTLGQDNANFRWDNANNQLLLGDGSQTNPAYSFVSDPASGMFRVAANTLRFQNSIGAMLDLTHAAALVFGGILQLGGSDLSLVRDAANTLAQRNGVNAQAFRLYNTFTDAANYERLALRYSANQALLLVEEGGTGALRVLRIGQASGPIFGIGHSTDNWNLSTAAHFVAGTDNTFDIGTSGANRPRSIFVGTSLQIEANNGLKLTTQTDGAAAQVGTLTNSPVAGNPAFWLPVTVNGTNRHIPCW